MGKGKRCIKIVRDGLGNIFGFHVKKLGILKRVLINPDRARTIAEYSISRFTGQRDYKKFIILGRSRTGSTLLQNMLNAHPEIHAKSEVLTRVYGSPVRNVFKDVFSPQPKGIKAVGFKMFYNHPLDDDTGVFWDELVKMEDLQVVHLRRQNILRTLISEKIAHKTNVWGVKKEKRPVDSEIKKVCFSKEELHEAFEKTKRLEKQYEEMFQTHKTLNLYYETFIKEPQKEYQRIIDMLGLHYYEPVSKLRKQNPEKLANLLSGYDATKKYFHGTDWDIYFDE